MKEEKSFLKKAPVRIWKEIIFRSAEISEVSQIVELEKSVWKEQAATSEQIKARIKNFPRGNFVALYENKIVAYCSIEYTEDLKEKKFSWNEITDKGFTINSHKQSGEYVYGINLSVHHSMNGYKLGNRVIFFGILIVIEDNKKGVFIGSRLPGFAAYKKRYPETRAEEYANLKRNGRRRDYELSMYESEGFNLIKILPNYFYDPASLNYGALVYWGNPYHNRKDLDSLIKKLWEVS